MAWRHARVVLPYLSRVLESEWCFLVLRRAARCPLMGTVLIRSKCTLLLLRPGRAAPERWHREEEQRKRRRKKRKETTTGSEKEKCGWTVLWPSCRDSRASLLGLMRFATLGKVITRKMTSGFLK